MQIKKQYSTKDAIHIARLGDKAFKFKDRDRDPRLRRMHWAGGYANTPACHRSSWDPTVKTCIKEEPTAKIDCPICLLLLGLKKNIKDLHSYASVYPKEFDKIQWLVASTPVANKRLPI